VGELEALLFVVDLHYTEHAVDKLVDKLDLTNYAMVRMKEEGGYAQV